MNCIECEERLSDYVEHLLPAVERSTVEQHFRSCVACADLLSGMTLALEVGRRFPVHLPPPWLASRIVANTPRPERSIRTWLGAAWRSLGESRTALAIFTAAIVMGWLGGGSVRQAIFNRAENVMSCAYDHAVRSYYRSPVVIEIHSRFDQLMENS
jgi:anti-sigma factor RsiW